MHLMGPVQAMPRHVPPQRQTSERVGQGHVAVLEPVRAAFEHSHERYGYRGIWRMLRDQGIHVCAKRVMRLMRKHGIRPRFRCRRRYNSYSSGHTLAPANIVKRRFHTQAPNRPWVTDITEFRLNASQVRLSPVFDCYDGMPLARGIGTRPTAKRADDMLEQACATLKDGDTSIIHSDREATDTGPNESRSANDTG